MSEHRRDLRRVVQPHCSTCPLGDVEVVAVTNGEFELVDPGQPSFVYLSTVAHTDLAPECKEVYAREVARLLNEIRDLGLSMDAAIEMLRGGFE